MNRELLVAATWLSVCKVYHMPRGMGMLEERRSRAHCIPGGSAETRAVSTSGLNNGSEVDPIMLA